MACCPLSIVHKRGTRRVCCLCVCSPCGWPRWEWNGMDKGRRMASFSNKLHTLTLPRPQTNLATQWTTTTRPTNNIIVWWCCLCCHVDLPTLIARTTDKRSDPKWCDAKTCPCRVCRLWHPSLFSITWGIPNLFFILSLSRTPSPSLSRLPLASLSGRPVSSDHAHGRHGSANERPLFINVPCFHGASLRCLRGRFFEFNTFGRCAALVWYSILHWPYLCHGE